MKQPKSSYVILTGQYEFVSSYGLDDTPVDIVRRGGMFVHYDNSIFPSHPKTWVKLWSCCGPIE